MTLRGWSWDTYHSDFNSFTQYLRIHVPSVSYFSDLLLFHSFQYQHSQRSLSSMAWPPAPPAATTPIDIANHVKRSASPVRSGLKPYIREQLHHRDQGSRLPDNPSVAAHFIPHKEVYDVAFISLRHMVFKVDGKSATPISHILHGSVVAKGGGSGEICGLIEDLCPPGRRRTTWFEQSEEVKLRWPKYARFRGMIEDARKQHAIRLRDAGMVDVDVLFAGFESGVAIYKRDQEIINKTVSITWSFSNSAHTDSTHRAERSITCGKSRLLKYIDRPRTTLPADCLL